MDHANCENFYHQPMHNGSYFYPSPEMELAGLEFGVLEFGMSVCCSVQ